VLQAREHARLAAQAHGGVGTGPTLRALELHRNLERAPTAAMDAGPGAAPYLVENLDVVEHHAPACAPEGASSLSPRLGDAGKRPMTLQAQKSRGGPGSRAASAGFKRGARGYPPMAESMVLLTVATSPGLETRWPLMNMVGVPSTLTSPPSLRSR